MGTDLAGLVCHHHFGVVAEYHTVALFELGVSVVAARMSKVVGSEYHVLGRSIDRRSVLRCKQVVDREHKESRFCLSFY